MPDGVRSVNPRTLDRREASASLDPVLEALDRQKWLALLVFGVVFCGIASLARSLPDLYRATATVLIERQQVSEAFVRPSVTAELETRLQTIREEVTSRARLTDLIVRFDLYPKMRAERPIHEIADRMKRDIRLEPRGIDSLSSGRMVAFGISYSGRDPQTVADVTNALAGLYVEGNTKNREGQAVRTAEFLRGQLADVKGELDLQEQKIGAFKLSHIGELPQQVDANLASIERLNTQLRLNGENQIRAIDRRERLDKQLTDAQAAPPPPTTTVVAAGGELTKLRQELEELRGSHFTEAPEVARAPDRVATLRQGRSATHKRRRRRLRRTWRPAPTGHCRCRSGNRHAQRGGRSAPARPSSPTNVAWTTCRSGGRNTRPCRATTGRPKSAMTPLLKRYEGGTSREPRARQEHGAVSDSGPRRRAARSCGPASFAAPHARTHRGHGSCGGRDDGC